MKLKCGLFLRLCDLASSYTVEVLTFTSYILNTNVY